LTGGLLPAAQTDRYSFIQLAVWGAEGVAPPGMNNSGLMHWLGFE
jgi:hypothetical protein